MGGLLADSEDIRDTEAMVKRFGPLVKLSKGDKYLPSSVPWYVRKTALMEADGKTVIKPKGSVTAQDLAQYSDKKYRLDPDGNKTTYAGEPLVGGKVTSPVYVNYVVLDDNNAVMQSIFFYPFNGVTPYLKLLKFSEGWFIDTLGDHEGDVENVDIYIKRKNGKLEVEKAFFAKHGYASAYANKKGLDFEGTHPIVYSALDGHASYPNAQAINKYADKADGKGPRWEGWKNYEILDWENPSKEQEWIKYKGKWGVNKDINSKSKGTKDGPGGTLGSGWFRKKPHPTKKLWEGKVKVKDDKSRASSDIKFSPPTEATDLIFTVEKSDKSSSRFNPNAVRFSFYQNKKYLPDPEILKDIKGAESKKSIVTGDKGDQKKIAKDTPYYVNKVKGAKKGETFNLKIESYY